MDRPQEFVLRSLEERDVRFVRLWFPDVLGVLKSVAVSPAELESAFTEGLGFDGSAVDGFARVVESDMLIRPDPSTYQLLPWRGEQPGVARMFCDILTPDGEPADADSRHVLRQALRGAADLGFTFYAHPEVEFFLLEGEPRPGQAPVPADNGGFFDQTSQRVAADFRRDVITVLESMGISVEFSHHEVAPGQQEIDLRYADALSTADNLLTFRHVVKEVALEHGAYATFMPKPFPDQPGSGMHTHLSLFDGDTNAFHDPDGPYQLSATARAFMAGVLRHAPELTAVTNQWVNSYKRLAGVQRADQLREAPAWATWGHTNRSALLRVPVYKPGKENSSRIEVRSLDPACNPYLAFAVLLAAGLSGVREGLELPAETVDDAWEMTEQQRRDAGLRPLPSSLDEAVGLLERSELAREVLGDRVLDFFLRNKRQEWQEYRSQVTPFELDRYLSRL